MVTFKQIPIIWFFAGAFFILGLALILFACGTRFSGGLCLCFSLFLALCRGLHLLTRSHRTVGLILQLLLALSVVAGLIAAGITLGKICAASKGDTSRGCKYVVVLGAGVNGTVPSVSLQDRLNAACDYLIAYPDSICIVSGGQGPYEDITEASCMYRELTAMGIDENRIWMEDKATSTKENLIFSLDLIESRTGQRPGEIGLVSSEYHLYRAGLMAMSLGVEAHGIPANTGWLVLRINYFLREIAAVWHFQLLGG